MNVKEIANTEVPYSLAEAQRKVNEAKAVWEAANVRANQGGFHKDMAEALARQFNAACEVRNLIETVVNARIALRNQRS